MTPRSHLPPLPEDERVLLLLGLLTSQDRHGYEMNEFIERQLSCVTDLKKATAYQLLDRLEQHALIESHAEQHGARPTRKVYRLTAAGHDHFLRLLRAQIREEEGLILPGNVPIMFCEHLPSDELLTALRERIEKLEQRLALYERMIDFPQLTDGLRRALSRIDALTRADLAWMQHWAAQVQTPQPTP